MSAIIGIIKPFVVENGPEFGIIATVPATKNEMNAAMNQARRHFVTRIIPRGGKAILAMRTSTEGRILDKHIKQDDGHFVNETVVCDCGGDFVADKHGEYVCNNCGLINAFEDNFTFEDSEEDDEPLEDEESVEDFESGTEVHEHNDAYNKQKDGAVALEARLKEHQESWKASKTSRPADEQYAKFLAHERKARHDEVVKANRVRSQRNLYENKWESARRAYRQYRILALVKSGMTNSAIVRETMNCSNNAFYGDIEDLTKTGRLTSEQKGRITTLTYIAKKAPARRVPVRKTETSFKEVVVFKHTEVPTFYTWKA